MSNMSLANEKIQKILSGAPDDAVYVSSNSYLDGFGRSIGECKIKTHLYFIADLEETLDLRKENERLKAEQAEVAAKAVEDAARKYRVRVLDGPDIYSEGLLDHANQLREKSK